MSHLQEVKLTPQVRPLEAAVCAISKLHKLQPKMIPRDANFGSIITSARTGGASDMVKAKNSGEDPRATGGPF